MKNLKKVPRPLYVSMIGTIILVSMTAFSQNYEPLQPYSVYFLICSLFFGLTLISNLSVQTKLEQVCATLGLKYPYFGGAMIPWILFAIALLLK